MIKPLRDQVLVKLIPLAFSGAIHLTERSQMDLWLNRPRLYEVLAVGPGRLSNRGVVIPPEVRPGDRVLAISDTQGEELARDGARLITSGQIFARVEPGAIVKLS